ncbi:MAG: hypothetical protein ACE5KG_06130 [Nitrososphaerales archaeon]
MTLRFCTVISSTYRYGKNSGISTVAIVVVAAVALVATFAVMFLVFPANTDRTAPLPTQPSPIPVQPTPVETTPTERTPVQPTEPEPAPVEEPEPTPEPEPKPELGNPRNCGGFLILEEIKETSGNSGLTIALSEVGSRGDDKISTICQARVMTSDGSPALTLTITQFKVEDDAEKAMKREMDGPACTACSFGFLGENSYLLVDEEFYETAEGQRYPPGRGHSAGFQNRVFAVFLRMQTVDFEGQNIGNLLDIEELADLAKSINPKLP